MEAEYHVKSSDLFAQLRVLSRARREAQQLIDNVTTE